MSASRRPDRAAEQRRNTLPATPTPRTATTKRTPAAITCLDPAALRALRPAIEAALAPLGTTLGLRFTLGLGHYAPNGTTGDFRLDIGTIDADGVVATKEADAFKQYATLYGLAASDLGRTITIGAGTGYTIVGLKAKVRDKQFLVERFGATYRIDLATIRHALGKA